MKKLYLFLLLLLVFLVDTHFVRCQSRGHGPDSKGILYVKSGAAGDSAGDSWENAIPRLSVALLAARKLNASGAGVVKQIWVAKGTYNPRYSAEDGHHGEDDGWNNAFVLLKNIKIFGGFAGSELSLDNRDTSKLFTDNRTVLDGNNKAYHVVIASGDLGDAQLDGFVIFKGDAQGSNDIEVNNNAIYAGYGGGLYNYHSSPEISNCIFLQNYAKNGGGIYNYRSSPDIKNCTFSGNFSLSTGGGAIYNEEVSNPDIISCIFSNNVAYDFGTSYGGGVYNTKSSPNFFNCRFTHNTATIGGAIYNSISEPVITNCILSGNVAKAKGGAVSTNKSNGTYLSCLFSGNKAENGGAFYINDNTTPNIFNCTIASNFASAAFGGGSIKIAGTSSPVIRNCILWGNNTDLYYEGGFPDIRYSIVQSPDRVGGQHPNLYQDPLFVNPVNASEAPTTEGDYRVSSNSPALDGGTNQIPSNITLPDVDLDGNARVSGSHPDIGAYELQRYSPDKSGIFYVNQKATGKKNGSSWANAFKRLYNALLFAEQLNKVNPGTVKQIWVAKGVYSPLYNAEDGHRTEEASTKSAFVLLKNVKLYGGFTGTETSLSQRDTTNLFSANRKTILDGQSKSNHILIAAGIDSAVLDGFLIQDGRAAGPVGSYIMVNKGAVFNYYGGGIYCVNTTLTISHCRFWSNYASEDGDIIGNGGGIYSVNSTIALRNCRFGSNYAIFGGGFYSTESTFTLSGCTFDGNYVDQKGGGIYIKDGTATSVITNCTFEGNYTRNYNSFTSRQGGGAIATNNVSSLQISNCSFKKNHTPANSYLYAGAILNESSSYRISNCTFSDNNAGYGGAMYNIQSSPEISDCSFTGNIARYKDGSDEVGNGGAIYNNVSSAPNIFNCLFKNNQANGDGGAIMNYEKSSPLIAGCVFTGNEVKVASITNGEIYFHGSDIYSGANSDPNIINCTIIAKDYANSITHNNTIMSINNSETVIMNSIIWGSDNIQLAFDLASSKIEATYSLIWQPNSIKYEGDGNIDKDPFFMSPADSNYHLRENSPALGTGTNNIAKYHLPATDIEGNPRVMDGEINMGAYASVFVRPSDLTAVYDDKDTVTISWKAILPTGEAYMGGDNFKLERSTDSTFKTNLKTVTSSYAYDPETTGYSIKDDITDISGGLTIYYRLTRTLAQNQDWERPTFTSVDILIDTLLDGGSAKLVSQPGKSPKAKVTWKPFVGVWTTGTQFNLIKKNATDGTQQSISLDEEQARSGEYIDNNIPTCKEIRYAISVKLGNHYASPPDAAVADSILTKQLAAIGGITASKGYYPDRTTLRWTTTGSYDHYVINRKVYGSADDYRQVATIDGTGLKKLQTDDDKGTPGVYYQYAVTGLVQCSSATLYSDTLSAIGFRSPTGTVYGRVTYEKGGGAVRKATVRMESENKTKLGGSIYLKGQHGSKLVIDSMKTSPADSAFTVSVWIKPDDTSPKNQIIFSNDTQYELGFDAQGRLYFRYNGEKVTGKYSRDTLTGYVHVAGIHFKDSLALMLNDSLIAGRHITYKATTTLPKRACIGGNSDQGNFKGYLDEIRLWNVARSDSAIAKDYSRLLTGGEAGLIAYWRFDATIKDQFYDLSHEGDQYHQNDGTMDPSYVDRSEVIPSTDQLSLKAYTDSTGNYTITGIPYTGINGTTYTIAPKLGTHLFDPVAVTRIFSSGSSTFTLDFKDKSSYVVSGYVTYQNTGVPVPGVKFQIDGQYAFAGDGELAQTEADGSFEISVPVGVHEVQAVKNNHVFVNEGKITDPDGSDHNYQQSLANVPIYDSTKVRFIGRVAGGAGQTAYPLGFSLSKNILGSVIAITLELKSQGNYPLNNTGETITRNFRHVISSDQHPAPVLKDSTKVEYKKTQIVIYPDSTTGEFEAELIPADFVVKSVMVSGKVAVLANQFELNLADSVAEKTRVHARKDSVFNPQTGEWGNYITYHDTVKYNASYIFPYRVDPVISVEQTLTPGNPNTVDYFGDTTDLFSTMDGTKVSIPLYDKDSAHYTFEHPVFRQNVPYGMKITSFEPYVYYYADGSIRDTTFVPSRGGVVTINNELKANSGTADTVSIQSDGTTYYTFYGGPPELADGVGLKGFAISVQIGSQTYQWNKGDMYEAYLFGGRQTGNDFVTTGPDKLLGILRDPPGSESYSFIDAGSSVTNTTTIQTEHAQLGDEKLTHQLGFKTEIVSGAPTFLIGQEIKTKNTNTLAFSHEEHWTSDHTKASVTTFNTRYQTGDDATFDGAANDVFIGAATNITFGTSLVLEAVPNDKIQSTDQVFFPGGKYSIVKRTGLHLGQKFNTMFAYPQYFIKKDLIPNLIKIRDHILSVGSALSDPQATANTNNKEIYVSKLSSSDPNYGSSNVDEDVWRGRASTDDQYWDGPSYTIYFPELTEEGRDFKQYGQQIDTILQLNQEIAQWKHWLQKNEKDKVTADYAENISFGAGVSIDKSKQRSSSATTNTSFKYVLSGSMLIKLGMTINGNGLIGSVKEGYAYTHDSTETNTTDTSTTIGYHLEENGSNYMSVDVGTPADGFYVFRTKGGVTSCPYEEGTVTEYYNPGTALNQPTVQREMPEITVDKPVVSGIAANRVASYTIHLQNASSVKGDIYFGLNVIDASNPYGAKIYMDGSPLASGRNVLIPAGEKITKTITLEKGPDSMDYNNILLVFHSTCQYNPVVYSNNIADTISLSAHFLPACSDIHLSAPTDQWLLNTGTPVNNDGDPYLPVVLDKYDLNKNRFNHIALQYKPSTSADWITVMKFYTDSSTYTNDKQGGAKQVIQSPDKTTYNFVMDPNFTDGLYDIRAVSVCMDNGQPIAQTPSNTVSGIKDTYDPRLFGNPQPANGILGIGDEVKLRFNETIDAGFLNHNNFTVRAIKNGAAIDSLVSVQLDGQKDFIQTEFDKNMTGKDFTVALWFMPDSRQGGTLFSQGNKNNSVELSLTDDYHLQAVVDDKTFTSSDVIPYLEGQWVHAALVYHAEDSTVSVFYNYDKVLTGTKAPAYTGIGPFVFGKSLKNTGGFFAGKIRNVRVWTEDLTSLKLQQNSVKTMSGSENHLLACYPMSEGKGNILFDKAHGNNAVFTGTWKTPAGKSISFAADGYVRLNTSQAVITKEMDFTLSVWFKANPDQINATILSSGKGNGEDPGGSGTLYSLGFEDRKLTFWNNGFEVQAEGNYLDNKWHHVVLAANRNTGTAQLYIDDKLNKYFDANNLGALASTYTYVGARAYHKAPDSTVTHFDQYFKGNIDEVRIWNTYLNSTLVSEKDNVKLTGKETGLLAYYPFEKHLNYNGIWSTVFTLEDQKIQRDPNNNIPSAIWVKANESNERAPMKDPGPAQDLRYDFVVNNDAIVFNFTGGTQEMKAIDKTIVTFTATDIKDMHGNLLASPITWTAYIDQNPLDWTDEELNLSKDVNKPMQFESYIINSGGKEENYHLDNLPPWLEATPVSGTVPPEGKQKITFTVNEGLNVGSYDNIVEMTNDIRETQGLALKLRVKGKVPDWKVNPADFQYNMTVYGKIRIENIFSSDPEDMLAAFRNGKCIGVVHNSYFKDNDLWYAFLTIYSNDLNFDESDLSFRIWDASTGKIYTGLPSHTFPFKNGAIQGTPASPVIYDGVALIFQNIELQKGWNWLSFNVKNPVSEKVNTVLGNGNWYSGDVIKLNNKGFASYSGSAHQWVTGRLTSFDNRFSYMLKTHNEQTLSTGGAPVDVTATAIPVNGNAWNYISYLPQRNMTLKEALAGYKASDEDVIKSQTGFAMYDSQLGWVGNLTYLEPGKGYMLYSNAAAKDSFYYPKLPGVLRQRDVQLQDMTLRYPGLDYSRLNYMELPVKSNFDFPENMTVIASVGDGIAVRPRDRIVAYIGDKIAGKALGIRDPVTHNSAFFFNISGAPRQQVYFKIERDGKEIAETPPVFSWLPNSMAGSLKSPLILHFGKSYFGVRLFPNPFNKQLSIQIRTDAKKMHRMELKVYNASGQLVYSGSNNSISNGYYQTYWNGKTNSGTDCTPGVYFIHLKIDAVAHVYKVIKL